MEIEELESVIENVNFLFKLSLSKECRGIKSRSK